MLLLTPLKLARFDYPSNTGCWLCIDAELAIGHCRMGLHGTYGLNNPWRHLWTMSSWVGIPGRPPFVTLFANYMKFLLGFEIFFKRIV